MFVTTIIHTFLPSYAGGQLLRLAPFGPKKRMSFLSILTYFVFCSTIKIIWDVNSLALSINLFPL